MPSQNRLMASAGLAIGAAAIYYYWTRNKTLPPPQDQEPRPSHCHFAAAATAAPPPAAAPGCAAAHPEKGHGDEACVTSARSIAKDGPGLNNPMDGYLVASQPAPDGFGGVIPEDSQGPPSTASESDYDSGMESEAPAMSFVNGKKFLREASFRKRNADKLQRAKQIRAKSNSLTSHLITPQMHNRRVRELQLQQVQQARTDKLAEVPPWPTAKASSESQLDELGNGIEEWRSRKVATRVGSLPSREARQDAAFPNSSFVRRKSVDNKGLTDMAGIAAKQLPV